MEEGERVVEGERVDALQQGCHRVRLIGRQLAAVAPAALGDAHRVGQHHAHQVRCGRGSQDGSGREGADGERQGADVVGVGVGNDHGVDAAIVLQAREVRQKIAAGAAGADACVDQDAPSRGLDDEQTGSHLRGPADAVDAEARSSRGRLDRGRVGPW